MIIKEFQITFVDFVRMITALTEEIEGKWRKKSHS